MAGYLYHIHVHMNTDRQPPQTETVNQNCINHMIKVSHRRGDIRTYIVDRQLVLEG